MHMLDKLDDRVEAAGTSGWASSAYAARAASTSIGVGEQRVAPACVLPIPGIALRRAQCAWRCRTARAPVAAATARSTSRPTSTLPPEAGSLAGLAGTRSVAPGSSRHTGCGSAKSFHRAADPSHLQDEVAATEVSRVSSSTSTEFGSAMVCRRAAKIDLDAGRRAECARRVLEDIASHHHAGGNTGARRQPAADRSARCAKSRR